MISAPLLSLLINVYAWRGAMLLSAAVTIQGLVSAAALRPVTPRAKKSTCMSFSFAAAGLERSDESQNVTNIHEYQTKKRLTYCPARFATYAFKSFGLSLWKSADFVLLIVSRGCCLASLWVMLTYCIPRAAYNGIDKLQASAQPFALGICSSVGRLLTGIITNLGCTNRVAYYTVWQLIAGLSVMISVLVEDRLYLLIALYGVYGLSSGMRYIYLAYKILRAMFIYIVYTIYMQWVAHFRSLLKPLWSWCLKLWLKLSKMI